MRLKVVLEPSEDGGYTVYVPALSGCVSEGETVDEALQNIREAVELYRADDDRRTLGLLFRSATAHRRDDAILTANGVGVGC